MPFSTVQCGRYFASASFCFWASCSGVNLERSRISTKPCQPDRSLPLNSAVKPGGGMLSCGPAFSSAPAASAMSRNPAANGSHASKLFIGCSLGGTNRISRQKRYGAAPGAQRQGQNPSENNPG